VPPEYTTQECSRCGYLVKKTLSTRTHRCPRCGLVLCRDHNAALNILRRGLELLGMVWNGTSGHEGTAPEGGTLGKSGTAAMKGQPDMVSALVEPRTRIPGLRPAVANALQGGEYVNKLRRRQGYD
jgi:putative transposase